MYCIFSLFALSLPPSLVCACCCSTCTTKNYKGNGQFHKMVNRKEIRGAFSFKKNLLQISSNNINPLLRQWCMCLLNKVHAYFSSHYDEVLLFSASTSKGYFIILTNFPVWTDPDGNCLLKVSLRCWQIKLTGKFLHKFRGDKNVFYTLYKLSKF